MKDIEGGNLLKLKNLYETIVIIAKAIRVYDNHFNLNLSEACLLICAHLIPNKYIGI